MKKYLLPILLILLFGSLQAAAQYIPGGSGGGGGSGSNCVLNSAPSDVMFNLGGTCAGNAGFTYDGVNHVAANDTGAAVPSGPAPIVRFMAQGKNALSPVVDGGPSIGIAGFTSGSFGGEPAFSIYAANGTPASPSALTDSLLGSSLLAYGYDGSVWAQGARIDIWNDSVAGWTPTDHGTGICLGTTGHGSTNAKNDALCVDDDRGVIVGGNAWAAATLNGYGTINNAGLWHKNIAFRMDGIVNTDTTAVTETYANSATGTNAGKIAKLVNGQVQTVTTADILDGIGICVAGVPNTGCTNTGNASIAYAGQVSCFSDGSVTAGHWVIVSTTIAGDCSDGGAPVPTGVEVLGTWISTNVGAGLYKVDLNPVGIAAVVIAHGGGGGGGAPATCNSTAESNNYACRNIAASWSAGQASTPVTVTLSTNTFTPDMSTSDNFVFPLVHASCPCQIANPTNQLAGQTGLLVIKQSATGSDTVTWGGNFAFTAGVAPTLQTVANAEDYLGYYVEANGKVVVNNGPGSIVSSQQTVNFNTASAPTPPAQTGFFTNGANGTAARNAVSGFGVPGIFTGMRANGTGASPSAVQNNDEIASFNAYAFNGSSYVGPIAAFRSYAAEVQSSGHGGTKNCIATTPIANTTMLDQFCINSDGSATLSGLPLTAGISQPQGRLTLVTGTPVMTSDQTAKSQIFYDCFIGKTVPFYNGTNDLGDGIGSCEVSLTMQTSGTGVTNASNVFDIAWDPTNHNICVVTNGSGGGWASDTGGSNTARGTGYSQVHNTRGYWTFQNTTTHCYNGTTDYGSASADRRTLLGCTYTTAAGQTGMQFAPAAAAGGANNILGLDNIYSRQPISSFNPDSNGSFTPASSTTTNFDSSANNRFRTVDCLNQEPVHLQLTYQGQYSTGGAVGIFGALDSTGTSLCNSNDNAAIAGTSTTLFIWPVSYTCDAPPVGIGYHEILAAQFGNASVAANTKLVPFQGGMSLRIIK